MVELYQGLKVDVAAIKYVNYQDGCICTIKKDQEQRMQVAEMDMLW